jgi:hypothetical protein
MNTLEHLMFVLLNAAPGLEKEELLERLRELFTAFHADGMCERDDDDALALRQLNTAWSQRYLPPARDYPSLYVIKAASTGYYKVGKAINPSTRVRRLQTGSPFDLEIVHTVCGEDEIEASRLERRVHELLDPHHLRGEWFDCSLDRIMAAIAQART